MKKTICLALCGLMALPAAKAQNADSLKHKKSFGIAGVPNITYDRSRGVGFGASAVMMLPLDKAHPATPPSQFTLTGSYTTKKDWMAFGFGRLFLSNDRYRLAAGGGYFNSNFQTFVDLGDEQIEAPYDSYGGILFLAPSVRVYDHLYVGLGLQYFKSHLVFDDPFEAGDSDSYQNSIGANVMYDSKDNQSYPTKGLMAMVIYKSFPGWIGNDSTFNKLSVFVNDYYSLRKNMVLASRLSVDAALGNDVPFIAQSYVGNKDIRGYTKGEWRGNQSYALQSELRWNFYKKFGAVGFFGLAMTHSPGDTSPVLPGGGVGLRYRILPKFKMNIGADAAMGRDDWGVYFRIGEAF